MMRRSRLWATAAALLVVVGTAVASNPAHAAHTPVLSYRWKNLNVVDADFNLKVLWAPSFSNNQWRDRVRDVVAQEPSCWADSCSPASARPGSYARWYLDRAHPYFGTGDGPIATTFNPDSCVGAGYPTAELRGNVSFHVAPVTGELGHATTCFTGDQINWVNIVIDDTPAFAAATPGGPETPCPWWAYGPADQNNATPDGHCDLMSTIAHEVGHAIGLGHYNEVNKTSVDPVCLNGEAPAEDPVKLNEQGDNSGRETMCVPPHSGSERQRTPGPHEKAAFRDLYPPTGPAPTISH